MTRRKERKFNAPIGVDFNIKESPVNEDDNNDRDNKQKNHNNLKFVSSIKKNNIIDIDNIQKIYLSDSTAQKNIPMKGPLANINSTTKNNSQQIRPVMHNNFFNFKPLEENKMVLPTPFSVPQRPTVPVLQRPSTSSTCHVRTLRKNTIGQHYTNEKLIQNNHNQESKRWNKGSLVTDLDILLMHKDDEISKYRNNIKNQNNEKDNVLPKTLIMNKHENNSIDKRRIRPIKHMACPILLNNKCCLNSVELLHAERWKKTTYIEDEVELFKHYYVADKTQPLDQSHQEVPVPHVVSVLDIDQISFY